MTKQQSTSTLADTVEVYLAAVYREVVRRAGVTRHPFDADDIASTVAEQVLLHAEVIMSKYPDPVQYARQRVRHAGISFDRSQRSQRGEGVRLHRDRDGSMRPGRQVASGDAVFGERSTALFDHLADDARPMESATVEGLAVSAELRRCCAGISPSAVREVWLIDGLGYSVNDVAEMCGQARETVSRRVNATRRAMQANRAAHLRRMGA